MSDHPVDTLARALARTHSRRHDVSALGSGLLASLVGTHRRDAGAQGNSAAARACKHDGYATRVRGEGPRKGQGFRTVGECVSYVAQGGTLTTRSLGGSNPCDIAKSYKPGEGPGLADANLSRCDLSGIDLSGADLSHSSLIDAYMPGANLNGANLTGANLYNVNLNSTTLVNATLTLANLDGALLAYADFTGANLEGATLNGAIWSSTTCPDGTNSDDNPGKSSRGHL